MAGSNIIYEPEEFEEIEEVRNYRDCAECGHPLIDVIFKDPMMKIKLPHEPKVSDICVICAGKKLGLGTVS